MKPNSLLLSTLAAAVLFASAASAVPASAWGLAAHQAVNLRAIDTLPKGLKEYYKAHRLEMPTLSLEATATEPERQA